MKFVATLLVFIGILAAGFGFALIGVIPAWLIWNKVLIEVLTEIPALSFLQAFFLLWLWGILFKNNVTVRHA